MGEQENVINLQTHIWAFWPTTLGSKYLAQPSYKAYVNQYKGKTLNPQISLEVCRLLAS